MGVALEAADVSKVTQGLCPFIDYPGLDPGPLTWIRLWPWTQTTDVSLGLKR